jgi:glycosyltransferase involved in cell wall biosynthesis
MLDITPPLPHPGPQISICIPVYNVKPYLKELLKSITSQDFTGITYEVLFVDDCSTDGSYAFLFEITNGLENIRILKNEVNSGISYTRNRLMDNAQGEYIWFVDSDDMIQLGSVKQLLRIAHETSADIVLANYEKVSENASFVPTEHVDNIDYREVSFNKLDWLPDRHSNCRMLSVWRGLFKKIFLNTHHLRFNEKVIMKEDALLYYEIGVTYPKTIKCEYVCYSVRQRSTSAMNGLNEKKAIKYFSSSVALMEVYQSYAANCAADPDKFRALLEEEKKQTIRYLLYISDRTLVKANLQQLKQNGFYPYTVQIKKLNSIRNIIDWLLSCSVCFWMFYFARKLKKAVKK